ncbi:MAG: N-6 DNA methylase [Gemmataceae bacterium]|nr:N-6 DNA methylase [Gemmataceae bacterium]
MTPAELTAQIARRDPSRSEATLQADIRQLLLAAPFSLSDGDLVTADLESPVGVRRRIDIEAGSCLVEVKRDFSAGTAFDDAVKQLGGYLAERQKATGLRYVGVLTDGSDWRCLSLPTAGDGPPREVSKFRLVASRPDAEGLLVWLEGVLATARDIPATPREIGRRLGAGSSAFQLDRDTLRDLFARHRDHAAVRMKRRLWAKLLTTALGVPFDNSDDLFVEHTYLVNTAAVIAHALLDLDPAHLAPASLLAGSKFEESGITGVVEADFFDWVAYVPGGEAFVRTLARRVARFRWDAVGGDVLKVLYESVVTAPTRKRLGEYYTPDWLAERVVAAAVPDPLAVRVLDPACGSGTFLFHAARRYLAAADAAGLTLPDALGGLAGHVLGMDLHPVAVTLARVTYLLAIGRGRLTSPDRGPVHVPVFLGDAIEWDREARDLHSGDDLVIATADGKELASGELRFPKALLDDTARFNQVVEGLTEAATVDRKPGGPVPKLTGLYQRHDIPPDARPALDTTFRTLCELHDQGRDHVWSYYVRNLARPWWLALPPNRVDVIVGNPPWLAYRFMTPKMQAAFRRLSDGRGLWHGAKVATHQDLSGLFLVLAAERFLKPGGRFAVVLPNAAVDRGQFAGLRAGRYKDPATGTPLTLAFDPAWDLRKVRPHFFPRAAAVLHGTRADQAAPLPAAVEVWAGRLPPGTNLGWDAVRPHLTQTPGTAQLIDAAASEYADRFMNGATIFPRLLFFVTRKPVGPLGMPAGRAAVRSHRGANDKKPWKELPDLEGVVETEFIRPVLLGSSVLPFRVAATAEAVLPVDRKKLFAADPDALDLYAGLAKWWRKAEAVWEANRASERLTLAEQLDYHGKLSQQLPIQPQRVVYTASGMHLAAARVTDPRAVVEHGLYWATFRSTAEAQYLCAVLNAAAFTELARPYMSYGKDERHFDKHIWQLPVPLYDPANDLHARLSHRGAELETLVAGLDLPAGLHFAAVRRRVREHMAETEAGRDVEELVEELLG